MRIKAAITGIVLGVFVWHTDTFQRVAFPVGYWTAKVNKYDADIEFTQNLIDQAGKNGTPEEVSMWKESLKYSKEDRRAAVSKLADATRY